MSTIGLLKGIVFKESVRKKLQDEQAKRKVDYKITWRNSHFWNY